MSGLSASSARTRAVLCVLLLGVVLAAYSNHFRNDFHFDDLYAIQRNPAIRDPGAIPRFFVDATLFSSLPAQRTYRPITSVSLAIDYWLGGGLNPFFFHLSTFFWFSIQLLLMVLLFERIMDLADPHPSNIRTAFVAAAVFGLHPAGAETVNYIIQRADLYNALGCVASLWLYIRYPSQRRFGCYLLPVVAAILAKPPALIFPTLLLVYALLFEQDGSLALLPWAAQRGKWGRGLRSTVPALAVTASGAVLLARMRVDTWNSVAPSPALYRATQPWVILHYFKTFFWPTGLNVDPGWRYVPGVFSVQAMAGYLFIVVLLAIAVRTSFRRSARPIAFGILWFLLTLLPTSLTSLRDVTNDHRMFFAFVGLTLAVCWAFRLTLFRLTAGLTICRAWLYAALCGFAALMVLAGLATRERNRIWFSDEILWRDSTLKNPHNGRAWDLYGWFYLRQGDYQTANGLFERAVAEDSGCPICEGHLVETSIQLNRDDVAERHLDRLVALDGPIPDPYMAYGSWLRSAGRLAKSGGPLERAALLYPNSADLRPILFQYFMQRDGAARLPLFQALDANHDLTLESWELSAASAVLAALDRNGDGKLSAGECGVRPEFMRLDPILNALDSDRDGEISTAEIRDAERHLRVLDRNGDGDLEPEELAPAPVAALVRTVLEEVDRNGDGRIDENERHSEAGRAFLDLSIAADVDGNGIVTISELTNEIFYRADRNQDGIVTENESVQLLQSGVVGKIPENRPKDKR